MDLAENLSNSFEYAKKLFSDAGRLIILIVLDIIPVVNWIVVGYATKVLRESPGSDTPPKLEKYSDLFIEGAKVFFASLVYMIIPIGLIAAGIGSFIAAMIMKGGPDFFSREFKPGEIFLFGGAGLLFVIIGAILAFIMLIVVAAGIAHMTKTGSFGKAFAFGEILGVIRKIGWGRYLAWIVIAAAISALVGAVAGAVPFIGWLIRGIISPALMVFFFRSLGLLYSESTK
ncbi:DUF4013 domain-containing protein [Candidatus Bathyarchaeota archaeon]|nr:DUF4013 domain-containing protein [Candidatus Bathyarchaeota archaeon]